MACKSPHLLVYEVDLINEQLIIYSAKNGWVVFSGEASNEKLINNFFSLVSFLYNEKYFAYFLLFVSITNYFFLLQRHVFIYRFKKHNAMQNQVS